MILNWKEDMTLVCPYCGHEHETVAYLNITETFCDKCDKTFDVELHVEKFTQVCKKQ